jgi:ABC-type branched-subunit amino acid transport system substrate-binding protein
MKQVFFAGTIFAAIGAGALPAMAEGCDVTVGMVMELTGPAGAYGQAGAKAAEMAFRDFNDAGGFGDGCKIKTDTRDSQSQGNVAVDQATQLVNIGKVPVVIGGIISSVSIPILTSVTAPAGDVQVSPASSAPTLTSLAEEGKANGVFFRTIPRQLSPPSPKREKPMACSSAPSPRTHCRERRRQNTRSTSDLRNSLSSTSTTISA